MDILQEDKRVPDPRYMTDSLVQLVRHFINEGADQFTVVGVLDWVRMGLVRSMQDASAAGREEP